MYRGAHFSNRKFMTKAEGLRPSIQLWLVSALLLIGFTQVVITVESIQHWLLSSSVQAAIIPLVLVLALTFFYQHFQTFRQATVVYGMFFAISITSLLGLTQTLTGSHAESSTLWLYGLSFYTASLAYLIQRQSLDYSKAFLVGNPLLLITGPILIDFRYLSHWRFTRKLSYFGPFVILGTFLHQTIATPLTNTFALIERTDLVSSILFAAIFELFVYANFCGLSLIVYGVAGIAGLKIPLNFRQPFSATNLIDFWKGWHTSLSAVLKALFYNPTKKRFGTFAAVTVVYLASAMWHGVTLNFVLWGSFHAACFIATMVLLKSRFRLASLPLMLAAIVLGRLLFADSQTERLLEKLKFKFVDFSVFGFFGDLDQAVQLALLLISVMVTMEFFLRRTRLFRQRRYKFYRLPVVQLILLGITLVMLSHTAGVDYAVYGQR
jgi:alginate O-acetyltransferase complex protein AlgI